MDTWARALLGSRLRSITLTDDYRIEADNGSGRHQLEHFSGGEQTLLALMLRVAIALFCRERAGFDTGFLILDEVFGDQDGEHRARGWSSSSMRSRTATIRSWSSITSRT